MYTCMYINVFMYVYTCIHVYKYIVSIWLDIKRGEQLSKQVINCSRIGPHHGDHDAAHITHPTTSFGSNTSRMQPLHLSHDPKVTHICKPKQIEQYHETPAKWAQCPKCCRCVSSNSVSSCFMSFHMFS